MMMLFHLLRRCGLGSLKIDLELNLSKLIQNHFEIYISICINLLMTLLQLNRETIVMKLEKNYQNYSL
jgi:hypothetical protein